MKEIDFYQKENENRKEELQLFYKESQWIKNEERQWGQLREQQIEKSSKIFRK